MLSLSLKSGEYITIGNEIVVQIFREGPDARVEVKAPREMTILRSEVLERSSRKPEGVFTKRPKSCGEQIRNAERLEKLARKKESREVQRQQLLTIAKEMETLLEASDSIALKAGIQELSTRLTKIVIGEHEEAM